MTAPTHTSFSLIFYFILVGATGLLKVNPITIGFLIFGSLIPDIDTATSAVGRTCFPIAMFIEKKWGHRTITHSFIGWGIVGIIALPLFFLRQGYYYAFLVGYSSHILIDCCNKQGPMIFWPSLIRAVLPGKKEYRIPVASSKEFILLAIFIVLGALLYPISTRGFTKSLHWLLGDIRSAVIDYQDYAPDYETFIEVKAVDNLTYEKIEGRFQVIGQLGRSTLIVACSPELRTIGSYEENNWRPVKVRVVKGDPINFVTQEIDMSHRLLGDIRWFLNDEKYSQRIYGSVEIIEQVSVPYTMELYNPISVKGKSLVFKHATLRDVEKLNIGNVYVKEGKFLVRTALKKGERLEQIDPKRAEQLKSRFSEKYDVAFSIEDKSEVMVKRGEKIGQGQVIAKIKRKIKELESTQKEISNLKARLKILTSGKESLQILGKRNKIKELKQEIETAAKEGKRLVDERKDKIDFLERKVELLEQQKRLQEREWEKTQAFKTQFQIDEIKAEIDSLAALRDELPQNVKEKMEKAEREVGNTKEELQFLLENKNNLEISKLQKNIDDRNIQKEKAESQAIIKSQVNGIVVDVVYSMTMEYLTRVQITVLSEPELAKKEMKDVEEIKKDKSEVKKKYRSIECKTGVFIDAKEYLEKFEKEEQEND
ncbi:metal-dependent hydrolase [Patescibacteria group bacterium]|nr:metal-dependent hydrolase [Patescibacteria group bacterium]